MKTVFKSDEIAHIWANRGAPRGRSPGNLSFDGDAISSYSTVIGRRITCKGKEAYVLDRQRFSVSTSKSQGRVRGALHEGAKVFNIRSGNYGQFLDFTPVTLAVFYEKRAEELANELPSRYAFKRAEQWQSVTAELVKARDVLAYFGYGTARLDKKIEARQAGEATAAQTLKAAAELKAKRTRAALMTRNVKWAEKYLSGGHEPLPYIELAQYSDSIATLPAKLAARFVAAAEAGNTRLENEWRAGERVNLGRSCPTMLRAEFAENRAAAEMVTSKGARVPLDDAHKTYRFAMLARAKGWHRNGSTHVIGAYQLDAVNEVGVVAGCHRVTWEEIERFAVSQGWVK